MISQICRRLSLFYGSESRLFSLVGLSGLEPPTSRLSGGRSNRLSYKPIYFPAWFSTQAFGGDKRDRTADPLLAKQVLSQLSYTPISLFKRVPYGPSKLNNKLEIRLTLDLVTFLVTVSP